jgi:hypothetical protein
MKNENNITSVVQVELFCLCASELGWIEEKALYF